MKNSSGNTNDRFPYTFVYLCIPLPNLFKYLKPEKAECPCIGLYMGITPHTQTHKKMFFLSLQSYM